MHQEDVELVRDGAPAFLLVLDALRTNTLRRRKLFLSTLAGLAGTAILLRGLHHVGAMQSVPFEMHFLNAADFLADASVTFQTLLQLFSADYSG